MAGSPHRPDSTPPGVPRWVKISGIVVGAVVLVLAILAITGVLGGQHGPGRHGPGGDAPPGGATEQPAGHTPPVDHGP